MLSMWYQTDAESSKFGGMRDKQMGIVKDTVKSREEVRKVFLSGITGSGSACF